jgi:hypothetical protein
VYSFQTFDPDVQEYTVAFLGDMAYDTVSDNTVNNVIADVQAGRVQMVIHVGDISYADGFEPHWDNFFNKIQPITTQVPYMVVAGNHEFWYNFSAYKHRFYMPGVSSEGGSGDNMFYSFNLGPVSFLGVNSETAGDTAWISPRQQAWMTGVLEAVDRSVTPWVIVYHHRPMYCSNDKQCDLQGSFGALLRSQAEDIYMKYHVDLVITGHVHDYERTLPIYQGNVTSTSYDNAPSPVHIVQGASGNREQNKQHWPSPLPDWSAAHSSSVGYGVLTVQPSSLQWRFQAAGATGPVIEDKFILTKTTTHPALSTAKSKSKIGLI